MITTLELLTN